MRNQQKWIEAIIKLPAWVRGVIGLTTAIIVFMLLLQKNYHLGITILGMLVVVSVLVLCIYLAFVKTPPLVEGGKGVYHFEKYRPWAFVGIGLVLTFICLVLFFQPSRSFVIEAFIGTPTPTEQSHNLVLNPTLAAMPTSPPSSTVTPGQLPNPVCASYFQKSPSPDYIQGSWTNDAIVTASVQICYEWMDNAILHKQNCAQPEATSVIIVLIEKARHTYNLPDDLNMNTEFVVQQDCLQ